MFNFVIPPPPPPPPIPFLPPLPPPPRLLTDRYWARIGDVEDFPGAPPTVLRLEGNDYSVREGVWAYYEGVYFEGSSPPSANFSPQDLSRSKPVYVAGRPSKTKMFPYFERSYVPAQETGPLKVALTESINAWQPLLGNLPLVRFLGLGD